MVSSPSPNCGRPTQLLMFKSQLQEYAQKAGLPAPEYEIFKEGPSHEPHFKAKVTLQDVTYESPAFYKNLKKAEHAAAEVALKVLAAKGSPTSSIVPGHLHESGLCKNLLQEYAQKRKLALPIYSLLKSGERHAPLFSATVEIAGVLYKGGTCKNKKEAEIKAAKIALLAIVTDSGGPGLQAFENQPALEAISSGTDATKSNVRPKKKKPRRLGAFTKDKRFKRKLERQGKMANPNNRKNDHTNSNEVASCLGDHPPSATPKSTIGSPATPHGT